MCTTRNWNLFLLLQLQTSTAECCSTCKYRNCFSVPFVCLFSFVRIFSACFFSLPLLCIVCGFCSPGREREGERVGRNKEFAPTLHYLLDMRWGLSYQAEVLSAPFAHYMTLLTLPTNNRAFAAFSSSNVPYVFANVSQFWVGKENMTFDILWDVISWVSFILLLLTLLMSNCIILHTSPDTNNVYI